MPKEFGKDMLEPESANANDGVLPRVLNDFLYGKSRKDSRRKVLEGSTRVFAQHGFAAATIPQLLKAAGISRRTFYQLYPGKDAVLRDLLDAATRFLIAEMKEAIFSSADSAQSLIRTSIQAYFEIQLSGGSALAMLQSEALRQDSPLGRERNQLIQVLVDSFAKQLTNLGHREPCQFRLRFLILGLEAYCVHLHQRDEIQTLRDESLLESYCALFELTLEIV